MGEEAVVATAIAFWIFGLVSIVLFAIGIGAVVWGFATGEITMQSINETQGPDEVREEVRSTLLRQSPRLERLRR